MAQDTNMVVLVGRLTRDAELTYTGSGFPVSKFSIAVNKNKKDGSGNYTDYASFFDVVLFGKSAEALKQYLLKGKQICVNGELEQQRWEKDGQSRSKVVVNARNVQLLGGGENRQQSSYQQPANTYNQQQPQQQQVYQQNNYQQPQSNYQQQQNYQPQDNQYQMGFVDDIPF